jgi:16S rRNA C1402 (ribose-2'-O) methylase RsmI
LSERAAETLRRVDFIAAEDTRVTLKLFPPSGAAQAAYQLL